MAARSENGKLAPTRVTASRSSLASSTRSQKSGSGVRVQVGHKRGVRYRRRRSISNHEKASADAKPDVARHSNHTEVTDNGGDSLHPVNVASTSYIRSKKVQAASSEALLPASNPGRGSQSWTEDVRQLSSSLAMDCDEAFNRCNIDTESKKGDTLRPSSIVRKSSPLATQAPINAQKSRLASFDDRPLPPPPARSESTNIELLEARKQAELRKALGGEESSRYLDRMVSHIDHLMQPSSPERRTSSAPAESKYNAFERLLPSIYETGKEDDSPRRPTDLGKYLESQQHGVKSSRVASAPEPRGTKKYHENRFMRSESGMRDTIRVVAPSSPLVKVPAPLTIRKKSSYIGQPPSNASVSSPHTSRSSSNATKSGLELRQQYQDPERINKGYDDHAHFSNDTSTGTVVKKKQTWFKRNSKHEDEDYRLPIDTAESPYVHPLLPVPPKKKGFNLGRLFKKRKPDMTIGGEYVES